MSLRIYLAGPWVTREQMPLIAEALEALGATITCKWWHTEDKYPGAIGPDNGPESLAYYRHHAQLDMQGVLDANLVVVINSAKSEGKAVEQGIALAHHKPIIIVGTLGEFTNVFHYLGSYRWVPDVPALLEAVKTITWLNEGAN